jgi:hypothetical protein
METLTSDGPVQRRVDPVETLASPTKALIEEEERL